VPSQDEPIGHERSLKIGSEIESDENSIVFQQPVQVVP
jgi:hypothetical protein